MSEVVNIPQLRFPGFNGRWSCELFNNIVSVIDGDRGVNYPKSNDFFSDEYCLFLSAKNVTKNGFIFNETQFIKKERDELLRKGKLSRGDIVLTTRGTVGQFAFYSDEVTYNNIRINSGMVLLRNSNDNLLNSYFFKACNSFQISRQIKIVAFGSAQPQLTVKEINKIKINLPTKPEQQKIAAFLTAVDNKIEQLSKKQELLGEYKKGAMQQIFSQAIRFKADDGSNFPDWEEVKLGNLTHKVGKKNKENIKYPIYSINNQEGFRPQSEQFDGLDSNDRGYDISLYKIVNEKTFAYNPARINVGSIGYSYNLNKVIVSSLYVCFKTNDELEDLYLLAYLDTDKFNKDILRYEEGGVRQYLFYENFSQISIPLPGNDEQAKISNFLSSIDNKIEQVDKQLDESKQFKKALLQQMFV